MTDTRRTTEEFKIAVDPGAVVAALRDRHEHDYRREGQKVMTVWPPFEGTSYAEHRFSRADSQWPSEMDVTPLDLSPGVFVDSDDGVAGLSEEPSGDWDDEWATEIRAALADEIAITEFEERPSEYVSIQYETE